MRPLATPFRTLGVCLALAASSLFGWTVELRPPPPGQLFVEHLWTVEVTNTEANPVDVRLHGWIIEANLGRVFEGTSNVIRLNPGLNRITSAQVSKVSRVYRHPDFRDLIIQTGRFPAGHYTEVCCEALRASDNSVLAVDCIEHRVVGAAPLRLLTPRDGARVVDEHPLFQWTPVNQADRYELTLCEVLDGQNPEDALESNRPWFTSRDIAGLSLRYPLAARRLETGKRYAWRVKAYLGSHLLAASPVFSFVSRAEKRLISREEAIQMILKRVIRPETLDHGLIAFLGQEPLDQGDTVFQDVELQVIRAADGPIWFAWLYDEPTAEFEHETRYVFIDAVTGELEVKTCNWWPLLNRKLIWNTREEMQGDRFVFFSNVSE